MKSGSMVAVMGPSGGGKTTLLKILSLQSRIGWASGSISMNGCTFTGRQFKASCFYLPQYDKNWQHLTCLQVLSFAGKLFKSSPMEDLNATVHKTLKDMGLVDAGHTKCSRLSGGQARRSRADAEEHFAKLGFPLPEHTNPSEHFMNLVNSDFASGSESREVCVEAWKSDPHPFKTKRVVDVKAGATKDQVMRQMSTAETIGSISGGKSDFTPGSSLATMFHRHLLLTVNDPVLYLGRCAVILVTNCIFAFVYWNARGTSQQQVPNQTWLFIWFMSIPAMMGAVAVNCLHEELKLVQGEIKNGMTKWGDYVVAKFILTLPITTLVFGLSALVIPMFVIQSFPWSEFLPVLGQWSLIMYLFESLAECVATWSPNTIVGMLGYLTYWIISFLFGGIFLPPNDLYWPLKAFYYALPFNYYVRTMVHTVMADEEFDPCDPTTDITSLVCVETGDGADVVKAFEKVFPVIANPSTSKDMLALVAMIIIFKLLYIA
ncbi:hypothetical protein ACHAXR_004156, partial [Thalassiosira sp. AJA248-18]